MRGHLISNDNVGRYSFDLHSNSTVKIRIVVIISYLLSDGNLARRRNLCRLIFTSIIVLLYLKVKSYFCGT